MNELNKKLAEWRFGEDRLDYTPLGAVGEKVWAWVKWEGVGQPPSSVIERRIPIPIDFPNDLNACFKWLLPKLDGLRGIDFSYGQAVNEWVCVIHLFGMRYFEATAETPALALCKAIEKLIDGEEANEHRH